jgi:hypothetical protein
MLWESIGSWRREFVTEPAILTSPKSSPPSLLPVSRSAHTSRPLAGGLRRWVQRNLNVRISRHPRRVQIFEPCPTDRAGLIWNLGVRHDRVVFGGGGEDPMSTERGAPSPSPSGPRKIMGPTAVETFSGFRGSHRAASTPARPALFANESIRQWGPSNGNFRHL